MSYDWRRRQASIGDHSHTADQILDEATGSAAGVSVDNGVDPPTTIATLAVPAASLSGNTATLNLGIHVVLGLQADVFDIGAGTGGVYPLWDRFFDDSYNVNEIDGLPDGLGISQFEGNPAEFDVNEAGVWAITFAVSVPADANLAGNIGLQLAGIASGHLAGGISVATTDILALPAGAIFLPRIFKQVAPAATPLNVSPTLLIVRIA